MTYEYSNSMPDAALAVLEEGGAAHSVAITESPFRIGRTSAAGKNTLVLDDVRISRQSAAIICKEGRFLLGACRELLPRSKNQQLTSHPWSVSC